MTPHAHRSYAIPSTLLCAEVQPASPDPVSFDASTIPAWTVADLFNRPPWVALIYHVMGTSYDFFTLIGALVGAGTSAIIHDYPFLPYIANCGLISGIVGMVFGLALLAAASKSSNPKLPFDDAGLETRANGLKHNHNVRIIDLCVWAGIALAGANIVVTGIPPFLSSDFLGVFQALSLGSAAGGAVGIACLAAVEARLKAEPASTLDSNDDVTTTE